MIQDEAIGFSAKAPVSAWNKRIGVDYPGVFKALLRATLAAATANAPGAISAAIDGIFAFRLEDAKRPPAELAWLLTRRALARAMAELSVEAARRHGAPLQDKDDLVAALDRALDGAAIWIDPGFFDRPAEHPIVDVVKPQFHEWLVGLGLNDAEANAVNQRFGAYFTFALRREWAEHDETYRPLQAEFQKHDNRFARADARERAWIRNADFLQRQIREPVFDEAFGLEQIYVPLRAWYQEEPAKGSRRGHPVDEDAPEKPRRIVVDLERHLDEWLHKGDGKDPLRVICGGPGSGKTSFAKMWAAKLGREGHRVLFVPLHRIDIRSDVPDIQAALWEFLSDLDVLPHDPLDARGGEYQLLILLDGLDELAMQGHAGREVARNLIQAIENKIARINERNDRLVQVMLGGRDIVVEAAPIGGDRVLHVLPYHGSESQAFWDPEELLASDGYAGDRWWRQFGEVTGRDYSGIPEPLRKADFTDITAQPLLNYLLALSYRRGTLEFGAALNLNLVYRDLLAAVYERSWGPARHPTIKPLSAEEFDQLLDELGLAAWHGAGRTITESQVERACQQAALGEQLDALREGARGGAISLLAAFYFRQAGKIEGERTFEFTHKSFGEYLTARRIVRWMEDIHEERMRNRNSRQRGWPIEDSLVKWAEITGPTALDHDLFDFLQREVALRPHEVVDAWRKTFAELFNDQLEHSLPMHRLQLSSFREMSRRAQNAEEALLAAHFCCANKVHNPSKIAWPNSVTLRDLMTRMQQGHESRILARDCGGWLDAQDDSPPQKLTGANLYGAKLAEMNLHRADLSRTNLGRADLAGANLEGANLLGANLFKANLAGARFAGANLDRADLRGADLAGADLRRADLAGANLTRANLTGANLEVASLFEATLDAANLTGATLYRANLEGAHLALATLEGANLERANLERADLALASLAGARLKGANLERAKVGGAKLSAANLQEAYLQWANLERVNLSGADLTGAGLERANLAGAQLFEANLTGANLSRTNLERADLARANLERANLAGAVLLKVTDLDSAQGLEMVRSWRGARIERNWVERLRLDVDKLGIEVVDDLDEG